MPPRRSLKQSIITHGVLLLVFQVVFLGAVFAFCRMAWGRFFLFLAITGAYHGLLTAFLYSRSDDFALEATKERLARVNLSNSLTFGRLSSIPTLLFLIVQASSYSLVPVLLPFAVVVFATDFLDGIIARKKHQVTFVGRYLDSTSDYAMIIAVSIIFLYYTLIPLWFFILLISRLVLFAVGMAVLAVREGKADPVATFLGKASIFATMVLYVMELAELFRVPIIGSSIVVQIIEWIVACIIVASVVDKGIFLGRRFSQIPPRPRGPGRARGASSS